MPVSHTLQGWRPSRLALLGAGVGMAAAALATVRLFYAANFPAAVYEGSVCDLGSFFNCDGPAYSPLAQVAGAPLGWFGTVVGGLVALGALLPSERLERTNAFLALPNGAAVLGLAAWAVLVERSVCLWCVAYWVLSLGSLAQLWRRGARPERALPRRHGLVPSLPVLAGAAAVTAVGAWGAAGLTAAERLAQAGGDAARAVREFQALQPVSWPSVLSPFWVVRSTERFEDAPIRVVEYSDLLCPDCLVLYRQLRVLKREFAGKLNVVFQPFPLETRCNGVVPKDKHPGACEMTAIALAAGPARFAAVHDEVFDHFRRARRDPAWRAALARRLGVAGASADTAVRALMVRLTDTGREYAPTSERYPYGVRSTPTLIVNNRMIIGTLPTAQLRAIFQSLVDGPGDAPAGRRFLESWVP